MGCCHGAAGEREADFVSQRIVELLSGQSFSLVPDMLLFIHRSLFADLDADVYRPGQYKDVALQKSEFILNGACHELRSRDPAVASLFDDPQSFTQR